MKVAADDGRVALAGCFRQHQSLVHGVVYDRCGNPSLAEEITAQTFEAAASQFARGRGSEVTPAWLTVVAKRRLIDHWRHLGARSRAVERIAGALPGSEAAVEPLGDDPEISAALDSLPARQRTVLTLRYMDDWGLDEIADGLGVSYRAVESLLARARRSFAAALEFHTAQCVDLDPDGRCGRAR
jgi:RNA polymerase sigma-70 factor (ECF subfamily)